jgi:hypothetical protein
MSRGRTSALAAVAWATALGFASACSDSSKGGSSSSSSSGSSSSGSSSNHDGGSSSSGSTSSSSSSSGDGGDAGLFTPPCTASAAGLTLIDDQSKSSTQIVFNPPFTPASCGTPGAWFSFPAGTTTTPSNPFTFSPMPAPIPADAGVTVPDATAGDASSGDGGDDSGDAAGVDGAIADSGVNDGGDGEAGIAGPMAACLSGVTGATAYSTSGMGFNFGSTPNPAGGAALPVTVDASSHTGVKFWIWGSTVDGGPQTLSAILPDVNQTPGFGPAATQTASGQLCDSTSTGGGTACGAARAFITVQPGWQQLSVPFASFAEMTGYSSSNEPKLDTTTLTGMAWWAQASGTPDAGVPYDFCVYGVSFY